MAGRKPYPDNFATGFGLTGMGVMSVISAAFMSSYFLVYLTDYAGLGVLGATIAPIILTIGQIIDAVDNPFQGWLIDAAKPRKMGKFKFFMLLSLIVTAVGISFLYSIPDAIKTNAPLLFVYVLLFYLMYDIGAGFNTALPLMQSIGASDIRRSKLNLYGRLLAVVLGALFSTLLSIVNAVNKGIGNFGKSFSLVTVGFMVVSFAVSLGCWFMVREGKAEADAPEAEEKTGFRDILLIFRKNRMFNVHLFGVLVRNFVYTFMTATMAYYTKWAYAANITTGEVNNDMLGIITIASSMITMLPMLVSAVLSPLFLKKIGSNVKVINIANLIVIGGGIALFVLQLTGLLQVSFWLFAGLMGILCFGNGMCFVPTQNMWLECMDYNKEVAGKTMGGTIGALSGLISKIQAAVATLVVGGGRHAGSHRLQCGFRHRQLRGRAQRHAHHA